MSLALPLLKSDKIVIQEIIRDTLMTMEVEGRAPWVNTPSKLETRLAHVKEDSALNRPRWWIRLEKILRRPIVVEVHQLRRYYAKALYRKTKPYPLNVPADIEYALWAHGYTRRGATDPAHHIARSRAREREVAFA